MITRNALGAIALATTCLAPLAAFAQAPAAPAAPVTSGLAIGDVPISGEVGIGVMGVMGNNPNQAGRYSGLNTDGINILGNFDIGGHSAWDSGGTRYYELVGDNLVFQTGNKLGSGDAAGTPNGGAYNSLIGSNQLVNAGSAELDAGDQGTWGAGVHFNSITYTGRVIDSMYSGSGPNPTLNSPLVPFGGATAGHAGPNTSYTIPNLPGAHPFPTSALLPLQTGTRRDSIGADFNYIWGDWTFTGAFVHEHKEGSVEESVYSAYGGVAFGLPVNYDTDTFNATAAYTTRAYQAQLQFTYSHFTDNNTFVNLPYPISGTAAPFQRSAAYSTPPSNQASYVTVMLADNDLIPKTRINLNARVGFEKQDDDFAPNTADPNPSAAGGLPGLSALNGQLQGTTATSLNAIATVYQVKVSANSNPFPETDARAYYGIDGRNVGLNQHAVTVGGEGGATADATAVGVLFVVPQDWLKQDAGAEVGYRIIPEYNTKVTVGYRLDATDRSNAQVGHSWTDTGTIALSSDLGPQVDGRLSFDYANRSGNLSYLSPWLNLTGSATSATYSGAFYQAPMTSEAVTARANYTPLDYLSGEFFVQYKNENYTYPATDASTGVVAGNPGPLSGVGTGLKQYESLSLGPDITYRPSKTVNLHFFYTYEMLFYNTQGNGACSNSNTGACAGSVGYFQNQVTTDTQTIGVSGDWQVNEKLKIKADATYSYGSAMFAEFDGVFVANPTQSYQNVQNYPDIDSRLYSLKVTATYDLSPNVQLGAQVAVESFHNNDWKDSAPTIVGTTTGSNAIGFMTPGYSEPNYSVVMLMTGIKFKF